MSEGLNLVTLVGNLGSDPELKQADSGPMLKMRVATNRVWFDKEQKKQERTDWHNVTLFGKRAEALAKMLTRGMHVAVKGRLATTTYEKNGEKRYWTEVVAEDLQFWGNGKANGAFARPRTDDLVVAQDLPF